jgi:hypothetical protein
VSSKHLYGRSDHVVEAMMVRGGGLRLKEKPSAAGGLRFETKKLKTQSKTVDIICFNYRTNKTIITI